VGFRSTGSASCTIEAPDTLRLSTRGEKPLRWRTDNVVLLRNVGAAYTSTSQYGEASSVLQRALELDPTFVATWSNLGTARYFQRRYEDAVTSFQKAVELAPGNYLYWGNLGDAYRWAPGASETGPPMPTHRPLAMARERLALNLNDTAVRSSLASYLAKAEIRRRRWRKLPRSIGLPRTAPRRSSRRRWSTNWPTTATRRSMPRTRAEGWLRQIGNRQRTRARSVASDSRYEAIVGASPRKQ
jgi:hypothetical protein